jgi:hypothetical protein
MFGCEPASRKKLTPAIAPRDMRGDGSVFYHPQKIPALESKKLSFVRLAVDLPQEAQGRPSDFFPASDFGFPCWVRGCSDARPPYKSARHRRRRTGFVAG